MRPALIAQALSLTVPLIACGANGGDTDGPERRTAAGEVLGGEVTDRMIPLDTVRSTAPPAPRAAANAEGDASGPRTGEQTIEQRRSILPRPEVSGGPEPLPTGADDEAPQDDPAVQ